MTTFPLRPLSFHALRTYVVLSRSKIGAIAVKYSKKSGENKKSSSATKIAGAPGLNKNALQTFLRKCFILESNTRGLTLSEKIYSERL